MCTLWDQHAGAEQKKGGKKQYLIAREYRYASRDIGEKLPSDVFPQLNIPTSQQTKARSQLLMISPDPPFAWLPPLCLQRVVTVMYSPICQLLGLAFTPSKSANQ